MSDFKDDVTAFLARAAQARDEARLQLHLATKEMSEEFHALEERFEAAAREARLDQTAGRVAEAAGKVGEELAEGYARIAAALKKMV